MSNLQNLGHVYLIGVKGDVLVKIGFTQADPVKRLGYLQTGCPYELFLIASTRGTQAHESWLHDEFSNLRVRGEWFERSSYMMKFFDGDYLLEQKVIEDTPKISRQEVSA